MDRRTNKRRDGAQCQNGIALSFSSGKLPIETQWISWFPLLWKCFFILAIVLTHFYWFSVFRKCHIIFGTSLQVYLNSCVSSSFFYMFNICYSSFRTILDCLQTVEAYMTLLLRSWIWLLDFFGARWVPPQLRACLKMPKNNLPGVGWGDRQSNQLWIRYWSILCQADWFLLIWLNENGSVLFLYRCSS